MKAKVQLNDLQSSVWRLFLTAHARLLERIELRLTQSDLPSLDWYDVLFTLKEAPDHRLRLSELADKVLLSRSNLTRLVDRLEKAGLLRRDACPSDRRGTFAVLTDAGLVMQQKIWLVYAEAIADYFACHLQNEEEIKTLQQVLSRLLIAAEQ
ncbi:MarR family transcriptional regulator [Phormidium sp. CLA17]|uniref:MarR family winged helix-turn-helix transcriptional regulator n=1 Tax=Leptolyngbya sp. Cla-17 TaxID=2803751 RepID=UPI0014927676|nr:MarR family transcriptional regulator [Leptolyngbya sp. Cla-17]MBM0741889.1 MarR family transcriptional regulator [Leptolyngbya sp. Cla-17]